MAEPIIENAETSRNLEAAADGARMGGDSDTGLGKAAAGFAEGDRTVQALLA